MVEGLMQDIPESSEPFHPQGVWFAQNNTVSVLSSYKVSFLCGKAPVDSLNSIRNSFTFDV